MEQFKSSPHLQGRSRSSNKWADKSCEGAADICRYTGSRAPRHLCKSLNAEEAVFIRPECFQDGPSSGRVYPCQMAGGPAGTWGPLPLITLRRPRRSPAEATGWRLMCSAESKQSSLKKCSDTGGTLKGPVCEIWWHLVVRKYIRIRIRIRLINPEENFVLNSAPFNIKTVHNANEIEAC